MRIHPGSSLSLAVFLSSQSKNSRTATLPRSHWCSYTTCITLSPACLQASLEGRSHQFPPLRMLLDSTYFPRSLSLHLMLQHQQLGAYAHICFLFLYTIINTDAHHAELFPSLISPTPACLFDTTSPISDVREGTPVSEVSLPSLSRNATTAQQSNPY